MLIVYGVNRKTILRKAAKDTHHREESYREIFQVLFLMVTPVIFTTFIYNCNAYLDNYLFFTILGWHGENQKALNAAYGEFSNYYVTLINVPLAMASASASAMMPEVSSCYATGDLDEANDKILETIRLTMFISIPAAVGLGVLALACGVTVSLKANVAASPEPVITPMIQGPREPPQRAMSLESFRASTQASIRPVARKPAAKTPAAMMMPSTSA